MKFAPSQRYARIYRVVERIPRGRVATYGQVASLADLSGQARQVGYALHSLAGGAKIPWQRVINRKGEVSPRAEPGMERVQREFLQQEGIVFDERGRVDLARWQWHPRSAPAEPRPPVNRLR